VAPWKQVLLAAIPVATVFGLIGTRRVPAWGAALVGALVAMFLSVVAWSLPPGVAAAAAAQGAATGLFPITYIVFASLLLYNLTTVAGWAARLRESLARVAEDRHFLLLLLGFGLAAFLDATAGFLTPVTVATALLAGLGVPAIEAAAYTLVASSMPAVFGAMGIPVLVMADVAGVPLLPLARAQAAVAAGAFLLFPLWLTAGFGGRAAVRRLWPEALAAGMAYGAALWWTASRVSPYVAGVAAAVASLLAMGAVRSLRARGPRPGAREVWAMARPWWPYWILVALVTVWAVPMVSRFLGAATFAVPVPLRPGASWRVDLLASPGTAVLAATLVVALAGGASRRELGAAVRLTASQVRWPLVTTMGMLALAQVMGASGMTEALGQSLARSGDAFPFLSPFLSWLGAAIAGSNTVSHALLGRVQAVTASNLHLDPMRVLAFAGIAAPLGKMVAPQVIAAAAAAARIGSGEARLLKVGLVHGLLGTLLVGLAALVVGGRP
jgi:L-lactate permease